MDFSPCDMCRDFEPIPSLFSSPCALCIHPTLPYKYKHIPHFFFLQLQSQHPLSMHIPLQQQQQQQQQQMVKSNSNPPLLRDYTALSRQLSEHYYPNTSSSTYNEEFCQLPLIDLSRLNSDCERDRVDCAAAICRASSEWGFFQVVNHGISPKVLGKMRREQVNLFGTGFEQKATYGLLNNSYRWGTPTATSTAQFSWSEAFHVPLTKVSQPDCYGDLTSLREVTMEVAVAMSKLARLLAGVLVENLGHPRGELERSCQESNCFLRLNRYPACPVKTQEMFGLQPHTDSDFLTILHQDQVGGLQLMKDSKWVAVKPNSDALIVNIGDLFQAWSNDVYKSVEHRVMANPKMVRYSIAYFLCPSYDSLIGSCTETSMYRKFTFGEYRRQVQEDVKQTGNKIGLPRFII